MDKKILVIGNSYMNLRMKINPKKKEIPLKAELIVFTPSGKVFPRQSP